jgi:hypothetical protein
MNGRGALVCQAPPLGEITHSDLSKNWRDGALPCRGERFARALALTDRCALFTFQPPTDAKKIDLGQAVRAGEEQE